MNRRLAHLLVALAAIAAAAGWFVYNRYFKERANPSAEIYTIRGIDISAHNGDIEFEKLPTQGIKFAYIKATEGADFRDRNFVKNTVGLSRVAIPTGAYHFFRFNTDGEMQAYNFLKALHRRQFQLPPVIDVEEWTNDASLPTAQVMRELRAMLSVMVGAGYNPIIYTNKDGYDRFVKDRLDQVPLWICSFTDPPLDSANRRWMIWQYSHCGELDGISGLVDMDTLNPADTIFTPLLTQ
jgi:lysozyme